VLLVDSGDLQSQIDRVTATLDDVDEGQRKYQLPVDRPSLMASLRGLAPDLSRTRLREIVRPYRDEWSRRLRDAGKSNAS
jgi:hypothetical protein